MQDEHVLLNFAPIMRARKSCMHATQRFMVHGKHELTT